MGTFYRASAAEQSWLMTVLFFFLILSLFYFLISLNRNRYRWIRWLNAGLFLTLFLLLSILTEAFSKKVEGREYSELLPFPMWLWWCIAGTAGILAVLGGIILVRQSSQGLSRGAVKQAMDTLPSAVCYFSPSGRVKLCNLKMYSLFRSLAQSDLQTVQELQQALDACDRQSGIIKLSDERQTYLFPNGKVWRYYHNEVTASDGVTYTEIIFFDMTELYEKNLELKAQTKQLEEISRELKILNNNVLTLTKEKEVLSAKTKLHDQMGAGVIAVRRMILQAHSQEDQEEAVRLFQRAVNIMKNDNESPLDRSEFAEFVRDADTIGVKIRLTGELPKQGDVYHMFVVAMRECLTNGVRHADTTELQIAIHQDDSDLSMRITNNGVLPKGEIVPKGGLLNLEHHITALGGTMEVQSRPIYALTVTVPVPGRKEGVR